MAIGSTNFLEAIHDYDYNNFCKGLSGISYRSLVTIPNKMDAYDYSLATGLLDISFTITISSCADLTISIPPPFNKQKQLFTKDGLSGYVYTCDSSIFFL